jgi:hypothetical protein
MVVAGRGERKPEARVIERNAAKVFAQRQDQFAIHKRPGRVAVQQQQRWPAAFVDVMHAVPIHREEPALKGEQRIADPGRARVWWHAHRYLLIILKRLPDPH